jgi:hypothetical protein
LQQPLRRAAAAALVIAAAALSGCGATGAKPDPVPIGTAPTSTKPAPPHLPAHYSSSAIFVLDLTDHATIRPATLDFASNGTLEHVQWSSWGGSAVEGHGSAVVRICSPSCVAGHTATYPATIQLSSRQSCFGAHFYGDAYVVADTPKGKVRYASFIRDPC